jgi:hypothetical protein
MDCLIFFFQNTFSEVSSQINSFRTICFKSFHIEQSVQKKNVTLFIESLGNIILVGNIQCRMKWVQELLRFLQNAYSSYHDHILCGQFLPDKIRCSKDFSFLCKSTNFSSTLFSLVCVFRSSLAFSLSKDMRVYGSSPSLALSSDIF